MCFSFYMSLVKAITALSFLGYLSTDFCIFKDWGNLVMSGVLLWTAIFKLDFALDFNWSIPKHGYAFSTIWSMIAQILPKMLHFKEFKTLKSNMATRHIRLSDKVEKDTQKVLLICTPDNLFSPHVSWFWLFKRVFRQIVQLLRPKYVNEFNF